MGNRELTGLIRHFNKRGFRNVSIFETQEALQSAFEKELKNVKSVGFGGSITTRELDLPRLARKHGKIVFDHWETDVEKNAVRRKQLSADLFVTAVNAVTENGIIVNADGIGNRVAASIFGPKNILFVVTSNKLCTTLPEAIKRVRDIATPLNARRLGLSPPCVADMQCHGCIGEERVDRVFVIHEYCPMETRFVIFILNQSMGY